MPADLSGSSKAICGGCWRLCRAVQRDEPGSDHGPRYSEQLSDGSGRTRYSGLGSSEGRQRGAMPFEVVVLSRGPLLNNLDMTNAPGCSAGSVECLATQRERQEDR